MNESVDVMHFTLHVCYPHGMCSCIKKEQAQGQTALREKCMYLRLSESEMVIVSHHVVCTL